MKIIFMGTPDFAVHSLNALIKSKHEVAAVFTQPDKPRNRGKKVTFSPVKQAALQHNIPVYQPETKQEITETVNCQLSIVNCIVVAAYGMLLPEAVLNFPEYGCINVHASLLPKYRGAAPINRAIMNGETESGITIMQMDKGLDTGDMLMTEGVPIPPDMTATELHDVLAAVGGRLIVHTLDNIGTIIPVKQDDLRATHAAKLTKAECELDLTRPALELYNKIRGLADYPCAYTVIGGKRVKIYRAAVGNDLGVPLKCADGTLTLTEIQPENGKRMSAVDYMNGAKHRL
jgi:methionyl-tRNA formyltransferase